MTHDEHYHPGQRELQDRFDTRRLADRLGEGTSDRIAEPFARFIESRDMFFLATADGDGVPQCSYKGGELGFVRVLDDLTIAFTMWGFLGGASAEVVDARRTLFAGLAHPHHYTEARALVDMVPEATLRMTPAQVTASFPAQWRTLVGI